ncbi:hypothetical protein FNJ47_48165, partial [Bradyrhizobium sp. UFLA 03-164]|nr:hypothetical protein [Bradyrhizobium uaiense]
CVSSVMFWKISVPRILNSDAAGPGSMPRAIWATTRNSVASSANHFMPGPDYGHTASEKYLNSRKLSIYGGSNEIQRNIIAKA